MTKDALKTIPSLPNGALGRLRAQQDFLSPSLKRVTDYILLNAESVLYQTITELADSVGVGEATVTRLCRKLGFPGFHAFKISLTSDLANVTSDTIPSGNSIADLAAQAAWQTTFAIEETRRIIDPDVVERVAKAIAAAPRIELTGQGNSSFAAQFFAHKLMRLGLVAVAHPDPHLAAVSAATLPRNGVLIAITRSGSTVDTVQNIKIANQHDVFTVAITNRASSPITHFAREVLFTASPEGPLAGGAISSLTSQVLVLEILYLALLGLVDSAPDFIRKTAESVVEKKF
ncbi:MurR/RpiR family transcriptional regulator [Deinococcus peraridilitoris]|uniref:Transcriptional regulator n=1 Tax=Deinococcus peraridilitoris (strain DSM 19664 / LMG 22246 / CIP 109416 / KR-200) TaxID=937777 RepID=K9ZZX0_DEIPD|nr:MurR/RpiR family transcriptional regulator [Deinococcus peraridilitoris]AFZ66744.1 transcriptional regulator [Deinococcus peraridilitoris DSM 19664]